MSEVKVSPGMGAPPPAGTPVLFVVLPLTVIGMASCYTAYAYSVPALHASGMPLSAASTFLFLYGVGAVLGNLTAGHATDHWGWAAVLGTGYVAMALLILLASARRTGKHWS